MEKLSKFRYQGLLTIKGRVRCPYLAIPIPGERPFVVQRDMFERVTRGITITDTSLDKIKHGDRELWALTITHRTGRVRGRFVFYNVLQTTFAGTYWKFRQRMAAWADSQKRKVARCGETKFDKQIRKLEREIARVYLGKAPVHPLLPGSGWTQTKYYAAGELAWHKAKADRKRIARIAGLVLQNHVTDTTGYRMLREAGYKVITYGAVDNRAREFHNIRTAFDYWRRAYIFCGFAADLGYRPDEWERQRTKTMFTAHAASRLEYLAKKRHVESLQDQIRSIRLLATLSPAAKPETGLIAA